LHHQEVVQLYKQRILSLEIELDYVKNEKDNLQSVLFRHVGLLSEGSVESVEGIQQKPIPRVMGPMRMRQQLEHASRIASRQEKK
jgi:hypothetical protein